MIATFRGLEFEYREDTTDWNTVAACVTEDEYGLADVDMTDKVVFDIGSHIGGVAVWCASRGARTVVAVEPVPDNARLIHVNAVLNHTPVYVVEGAIGKPGDPCVVRHSYGGNFNAEAHRFIGNTYHVWKGDPPEDVTFQETEVPNVSLHDLVARHGRPDILKLDCEGGEWYCLKEAAAIGVPLIVGEWHPLANDTTGDPHRMDEVRYMLGFGYEIEFSGPVAGPGGFRATLR